MLPKAGGHLFFSKEAFTPASLWTVGSSSHASLRIIGDSAFRHGMNMLHIPNLFVCFSYFNGCFNVTFNFLQK